MKLYIVRNETLRLGFNERFAKRFAKRPFNNFRLLINKTNYDCSCLFNNTIR